MSSGPSRPGVSVGFGQVRRWGFGALRVGDTEQSRSYSRNSAGRAWAALTQWITPPAFASSPSSVACTWVTLPSPPVSKAVCTDDARPAQPHRSARSQALEPLGGIGAEIVRSMNSSRAQRHAHARPVRAARAGRSAGAPDRLSAPAPRRAASTEQTQGHARVQIPLSVTGSGSSTAITRGAR